MKYLNCWNCIGAWLLLVLASWAYVTHELHQTYDKLHDHTPRETK